MPSRGKITIMNEICRICLNLIKSTDEMQELSEGNDIYLKLQLSMSIKIQSLGNLLPKMICKCCSQKVEDVCNFHKQIMETENVITQYINEGRIDINELLKLRNRFKQEEELKIKLDNKENELFDQDNVKLEINTETGEFDAEEETNFMSDNNIEIQEDNPSGKTIDNKPVLINNTQFKCLTCFDMFETRNLLLNHYNTQHFKKHENVNMEDNFNVISLDGNVIFKCNNCDKQYNNRKAIVRHNLLTHVNGRPFICKLCGRTYKTASDIVRHSRAHDGTRLFCSKQCGYSTVYHGALKEHEERHNKAALKYKCEKCGKCFQARTWYEQHQNIHNGLKPFVCDICGVAFHMDRYLTSHRSSVHPQSSSLKRYVCVHCSHPCDSQNALNLHLKEHGVNTSFLCDICGKALSNSKQLNFHKKMHLGEKPFSCSTCDKSFTKKFNLQLHERTHSGEKAHACLQCGKCYSQKSNLRRHNARHHSSYQQQCQKCNKAFSSENLYVTHKKHCISPRITTS